jgi:hypothetical protein
MKIKTPRCPKPLTIIVPVYNDVKNVTRFLAELKPYSEDVHLLIANASTIPEVSAEILRYPEFACDISVASNKYWSGTINAGLNYYLLNLPPSPRIAICNVDVRVEWASVLALLPSIERNNVVVPLVYSGSVCGSSGVRVRSWPLALTVHPFAGFQVDQVPFGRREKVDFAPTRCVVIPNSGIYRAGPILESRLPHYAADYEYTNRLRRSGL